MKISKERMEERLKSHARAWNEFRILNETSRFDSMKEICDLAREKGLPYAFIVPYDLQRQGSIVLDSTGYRLTNKPIHYSVLACAKESSSSSKQKKKEALKAHTEPAALFGGRVDYFHSGDDGKKEDKVALLEKTPDLALVEELRRRGYDVTASKFIEL